MYERFPHNNLRLVFLQIDGINYNYNVYVCLNSGTVVWLVILYIYKGLLQLAAMLMAFHIRRVKIKAFNDSKEIAICIYLNCVTLLLLAVVEFTLSAYHEAYAAVFGAGLMVGATLFLTLVFIPRVCKEFQSCLRITTPYLFLPFSSCRLCTYIKTLRAQLF